MNFSSLYLLCSIALITDVETVNLLLCPHKLLYISFVEQGLLFKVLERLVVQLFDWMDPGCALAKNLTFGTDAGSGGPDGLPDP